MSVDYSAHILYGVLIDEKIYKQLLEEEADSYVYRSDCYTDQGDIVLGIKVKTLPFGKYTAIDPTALINEICSNETEYNEFLDLLARYEITDSPSFYGGVRVW